MALYREGKAAMAADGTVTGTGTKWQSSLSLIRPGATIMFLSSPIQIAVVNKVVSDTEIKAITTNGAVVASTDYAILLSDSLTVDGLAQDVAETLRYYQSQETVIADAVEFFNDFDFESLQNLANQIKADSEAAESSATAAAASENAAKTSEVAAENVRDQVQQIINDAGEQSTLVALAQPSGAEKIGMPFGGKLNYAVNWVFPEAFGTEYNETMLQAAVDYAVAHGLLLVANNRTFTLNGAVKFPTQLNADFTGTVIISGPGITSGATIKISGPASVVAGQHSGTIHNLTLRRQLVSGHADTSSNVDGISFGGSDGQSSDMSFYNLQVIGFRDNVRFDGPDTYLNHFIIPRIGICWRRAIAVYASVNSNENNGFIGGSVFNANNPSGTAVGVYIDPAASATDLYFNRTSIDYCDNSIVQYQSTVNCVNCHFENNNNNPHVTLSYTGGKERPVFVGTGGTMGGGPGVVSWTGKPSKPLTPTEQAGGRPCYIYVKFDGQSNVHINGMKCGGYLAGQRRNTQLVKVQYNQPNALNSIVLKPILDAGNADSSSRPMRLCDAINCILVSPYDLNAWTQSYGSGSSAYVFSTDTSVYYDEDSPSSRKYVGTEGINATGLYQEIPCSALSVINVHAEVKVTTLTQGYCALRVDFYDFKGNVISSSIKSISAVTDWTQVWVYTKVPNGAVKVRIQEYYNAFIGTAYFSNENVWFH